MIFEKNLPWTDHIKIRSTPSAAAPGGEAWRRNVCRPVYIRLLLQLNLTLACIKALSKTLHTIHGSIIQLFFFESFKILLTQIKFIVFAFLKFSMVGSAAAVSPDSIFCGLPVILFSLFQFIFHFYLFLCYLRPQV